MFFPVGPMIYLAHFWHFKWFGESVYLFQFSNGIVTVCLWFQCAFWGHLHFRYLIILSLDTYLQSSGYRHLERNFQRLTERTAQTDSCDKFTGGTAERDQQIRGVWMRWVCFVRWRRCCTRLLMLLTLSTPLRSHRRKHVSLIAPSANYCTAWGLCLKKASLHTFLPIADFLKNLSPPSALKLENLDFRWRQRRLE